MEKQAHARWTKLCCWHRSPIRGRALLRLVQSAARDLLCMQQPHPDLAVQRLGHEHSPGPGRPNFRCELGGGVQSSGGLPWHLAAEMLSQRLHSPDLQKQPKVTTPAGVAGWAWLNQAGAQRAVFQKMLIRQPREPARARNMCFSHSPLAQRITAGPAGPAGPIKLRQLRTDNKSMACQ